MMKSVLVACALVLAVSAVASAQWVYTPSSVPLPQITPVQIPVPVFPTGNLWAPYVVLPAPVVVPPVVTAPRVVTPVVLVRDPYRVPVDPTPLMPPPLSATTTRVGDSTYTQFSDGVSATSNQVGAYRYTTFSNGTSCTTSRIGTYVYTNCF